MIEFRGTYHQKAKNTSVLVLVQFDGVLLHVWHHTEPFYRILSCDVFQSAVSLSANCYIIKLPNGDRVETDDAQAIDQLNEARPGPGAGDKGTLKHRFMVAAVAAVAAVAIGCWILWHQSLIF